MLKSYRKIKPNLIAAHIGLGDVWFARRNFDKAVVAFSKALNWDKGIAGAYLLRGASYCLLGKMDLALSDLRKAIELNRKPNYNFSGRYRVLFKRFGCFN